MQEDNRKEAAAKSVTFLAEFYEKSLTPERLEVYMRALDDIPTTAWKWITKEAIRKFRTFPVPSDLLAIYRENREAYHVSQELKPLALEHKPGVDHDYAAAKIQEIRAKLSQKLTLQN